MADNLRLFSNHRLLGNSVRYLLIEHKKKKKINITLSQIGLGFYEEVDRIEENVCLTSTPAPESKAYLVVGLKSNKGSPERMLEESWKEWTGARYMYLNAADEFCLSSIR
jgi:hypothetical protein